MEKNLSFFHDRPINTFARDWMWKDDLSLDANQQIKEIARRIIGPLTEEDGFTESLTFAIHGSWGSGKTSFVELILAQARAVLQEQDIPENRLIFCKFNASSMQNSSQPARASMAMQVLLSLAETTMDSPQGQERAEDVKSKALQIFTSHAYQANIEIDDIADKKLHPIERITKINRFFEEVVKELAGSHAFSETIQAELEGRGLTSPMTKRVLVVFVDDLDRCRTDYVSQILNVIQQWGTTQRLYFILAIDRSILDNVIREYYDEMIGTTDDAKNQVAIEKYVQHSFEIPELNEDGVRNYLAALFRGYEDTPLAKVLLNNIPMFTASLRVRTPRSIKRCINTIRLPLENANTNSQKLAKKPEEPDDSSEKLAKKLEDPNRGSDKQQENLYTSLEQRCKEELLKFTWRNFYNVFYLPARRGVPQFVNAFQALERAAAVYASDGDTQLYDFDLARIRQRLQVGEETLPTDYPLASFLGEQPWFFITTELIEKDAATLLHGIVSADTPQTTPQRQFDELYQEYQKIDHEQEPQVFVNLAVKVLQLASENMDALSEQTGPRIGNIALRVESMLKNHGGQELQQVAYALFDISYRLSPQHANNNCNFASFIVDTQIPPLRQLYEPAYQQILGNDPYIYRMAQKLDRYYYHRAELAIKLAAMHPEMVGRWEEHIMDLVRLTETEANEHGILRALLFVSKFDISDEHSIQLLVEPIMLHTSGHLRNLSLKGLGDSFDDSLKSCELYRWVLLQTEPVTAQEKELYADIQHNYAVHLVQDNLSCYQDALDLWYAAYNTYIHDLGKSDPNVSAAFALFIRDSCNEKDYIELVQAGQPLPAKPTISKESRPIPDEFVPGGIRTILGDFVA